MSKGPTSSSPATPSQPNSRFRGYGSVVWPAVVVLAGLYFLLLTKDIHSFAREGRLGPDWWPTVILVILIVTAVTDFLIAIRERRSVLLVAIGSAAEGQTPRSLRLLALGVVSVITFVGLAPVIGFALAAFLFLFAFITFGGLRRPITILLISIAGTVISLLLFGRLVYISLPRGIEPFQSITQLIYSLLGMM